MQKNFVMILHSIVHKREAMHKILVLEDSKLIQDIIVQEIDKYPSLELVQAYSYADAIKSLRRYRDEIEFAIIDLNLPDADSKKIIAMINSHRLPTIIYSGSLNDKLKELVYEEHVYDYVIKDNKNSLHYALKRIESYLKVHHSKLLVVDDSKTTRMTLAAYLEDVRIDIVECSDGKEALDYISDENNKIALVITDYQMPNMDGLELCMRIRSLYNKDEVALIAISANDDRATIHKFLQVGANDFITKPLDPDEVILKVRSQLEFRDLFKKTRDMANKDFLTGAFNRRYFFDSAQAIIGKNRRKSQPLAVAMLDIDKFKNINDTYGHDTGDVAIKEVKNILTANIRSSDLMARFGGEEFAILLEDISLSDTEKLFEKIRSAFETNTITFNGNTISYTVSIGIFYAGLDDIEHGLAKADEALYEAKNSGRNRVVIYQE